MKIECNLNELGGDWWFALGVNCQKTEYHHKFRWVLTIELMFVSVYVRWGAKV